MTGCFVTLVVELAPRGFLFSPVVVTEDCYFFELLIALSVYKLDLLVDEFDKYEYLFGKNWFNRFQSVSTLDDKNKRVHETFFTLSLSLAGLILPRLIFIARDEINFE